MQDHTYTDIEWAYYDGTFTVFLCMYDLEWIAQHRKVVLTIWIKYWQTRLYADSCPIFSGNWIWTLVNYFIWSGRPIW